METKYRKMYMFTQISSLQECWLAIPSFIYSPKIVTLTNAIKIVIKGRLSEKCIIIISPEVFHNFVRPTVLKCKQMRPKRGKFRRFLFWQYNDKTFFSK